MENPYEPPCLKPLRYNSDKSPVVYTGDLEQLEREIVAPNCKCQEPITRSVQLPYIRVTAFSQTYLFLD